MQLLGYQDVARIAEVAVYSKEHLLLIGPPGTAKSLFARKFFSQFEGELFMTQLSRWSDETTLFGPPDFKRLRSEGILCWKPAGLLVAEWAFLDEIFDASDVLLRTLLGILNEREFRRGAFHVKVPLQSAIATANYTRINEVTEAVIDRFCFVMESPCLTAEQRLALWQEFSIPLNGDENGTGERISLSRIFEIRERAKQVSVPAEVAQLGSEFSVKLGFSPRREAKAAWVTKVYAAMYGRQVATFDDLLAVFPHLLLPSDDLASRKKEITDEMRKKIDILTHEQQQLQQISSVEWHDGEPSDLEQLKEIAKRIRSLREIKPVSERVEKKKVEVLNKLQHLHAKGLERLGVIV